MNRMMFDLGCRLALLATNLDDSNQALPPELREDTRACIERMHALAKALLGDFAGEFYDETAEGAEAADPGETIEREALHEA